MNVSMLAILAFHKTESICLNYVLYFGVLFKPKLYFNRVILNLLDRLWEIFPIQRSVLMTYKPVCTVDTVVRSIAFFNYALVGNL